ncbi:galactose-binding domain-like protein [Cladochytrium replicatum]|nr:galactose-binding domain-like protein [Cladochytrium replicatum]
MGSALSRMVATLISYVQEHEMQLPPALTRSIHFDYDVRVPTRDGLVLLGTHIYPRSMSKSEPLPLVLIRSPYGRANVISFRYGRPFAERGFQVFIQSCRGTTGSGFPSDGTSAQAVTFYPYKHEMADGVDMLQWIRKQTWYPGDGKVVTFGPSYLGHTQWAVLTASDLPPNVIAASAMLVGTSNMKDGSIVPSWEVLPGEDPESPERPSRVYPGIFHLENVVWWMRMLDAQAKGGMAFLSVFRQGMRKQYTPQTKELFEQLPVLKMDERTVEKECEWYRAWQTTSEDDADFWAAAKRTPHVPSVTIPMSMVTGWYDIFLPGQIHDFKNLQARLGGSEKAPRLMIGPWVHTGNDIAKYGILEIISRFLPLVSGTSKTNGHPSSPTLAAYASTGGDRVLPVRLFVMGSNVWKDFAAFPPESYAPTKWYLHSGGLLDRTAPADTDNGAGYDSYVYDPKNPTPQVGGAKLYGGAGPANQHEIESRSDVLVYTSATLESDIETVSDDIHVILHASSTSTHTDFVARLCDVDAAGTSTNVTDGVIRLDGSGVAEEARCFRINLSPTAYCFKKGHKIRLQVCSAAFPRFVRNMGTGEHFANATEGRKLTQKVMRSGLNLTHLVIPSK